MGGYGGGGYGVGGYGGSGFIPSAPATSIYQLNPLVIVNFDFEASPGVLPPVGWNVSGSATLSYDTTTPYEGSYSLIITATQQFAGVLSAASYPVVAGQIYLISAAIKSNSGDPVAVQFICYDINGNPLPGPVIVHSSTVWGVYSSRESGVGVFQVPYGAVSARVQLSMTGPSGGIGEFDVIQVSLLSNAIPYYLNLITSQYRNSPNFMQLLAVLLEPFVDTAICAASITNAFNIQQCFGKQLDVLGTILGVSRTLPFSPVGVNALTTAAITSTGVQSVPTNNVTYATIGGQVTITGSDGHTESPTVTGIGPGNAITANFTLTHVTNSSITSVAPSALLGDSDFQLLLQAKVLQNQFNGQLMGTMGQLWAAWQVLFPGGRIYITDNQNMTATLFLVGSFSPLTQQMITNGLIVPRPQAVQYIYEFATLPIFGFDNLNPTFIAGWGTGTGTYPGGNWA